MRQRSSLGRTTNHMVWANSRRQHYRRYAEKSPKLERERCISIFITFNQRRRKENQPEITPEDGVASYAHDMTQGPACAIAAGPATAYRNYFVKMGKERGQVRDRQIDNLSALANELKNKEKRYWAMINGYVNSAPKALQRLNEAIESYDDVDKLRSLVKIGLQYGAEVTFRNRTYNNTVDVIEENEEEGEHAEGEAAAPKNGRNTVSQAFCSALSIRLATFSPSLKTKCYSFTVSKVHWQKGYARQLIGSSLGSSSRLLLSSQESDEGTGDDSDEDPDDDKEDDEDNEDDDNDDDGDGDSVLSGGKECGSSIQAAQEERGGEEETPAPGKTNRERDEEDGDDNDDNDDDNDEDGDDNDDNDDDNDDDEDGQHKPEMKIREKAMGNPEKIATSASGSSRSAKICW
eukprot:jgi/Bigna1/90117/estExt_fgenesh1_pg.C_620126